jgi:hypothetical protein
MGDIETASFRSGSDAGTLQVRRARPPSDQAPPRSPRRGVGTRPGSRVRACARPAPSSGCSFLGSCLRACRLTSGTSFAIPCPSNSMAIVTRDRSPPSSGSIVPLAIAVSGPPIPRTVQAPGRSHMRGHLSGRRDISMLSMIAGRCPFYAVRRLRVVAPSSRARVMLAPTMTMSSQSHAPVLSAVILASAS